MSTAQQVLQGWMHTITTISRKRIAQVMFSVLVAITGVQRSLAAPHPALSIERTVHSGTHHAKAVTRSIARKASVELTVVSSAKVDVKDYKDSAFDTPAVVSSRASEAKMSITAVPAQIIPTIVGKVATIAKFPVFGKFGHLFRREVRCLLVFTGYAVS